MWLINNDNNNSNNNDDNVMNEHIILQEITIINDK